MQVTIDVSMYPNREDFIPPIKGFIEKINRYSGLEVQTFPTSTVVQGEYQAAFNFASLFTNFIGSFVAHRSYD